MQRNNVNNQTCSDNFTDALTNYLNTFYTDDDNFQQIHFGINIYLLEQLQQYHILKPEADISRFIEANRDDFEFDVIFKNFFDPINREFKLHDLILFLLNKPEVNLIFPSNIHDQLNHLINNNEFYPIQDQFLELLDVLNNYDGEYKDIGLAHAIAHDIGFIDGFTHREKTLGINENKSWISYKLDKEFSSWPINKIKPHVFAAKGLTNDISEVQLDQSTLFLPDGFFKEILNLGQWIGQSNGTQITHIVALGIPEQGDFPAYFIQNQQYYTRVNDQIFSINIVPQLIPSKTSDFQKYELQCHIKGPNNLEITQTINVLHIPIADGSFTYLSVPSLIKFYDILLRVIENKEDIIVHCRGGWGRTGQIIFELMAILDNFLDKLYLQKIAKMTKTEKEKREVLREVLLEFADELRQNRAGLLSEKTQFLYFLINYLRYTKAKLALKIKAQSKNASENDNSTTNSPKKRRHHQATTQTNANFGLVTMNFLAQPNVSAEMQNNTESRDTQKLRGP